MIKEQRFGIEIELTGITRMEAAKAVAKILDSREEYEGGCYKVYTIRDQEGRKWKIERDASILTQVKTRNGIENTYNDDYKVEFVSPICTWEDIETIQEIVRELRHRGAIANTSCGIHVHVDASIHTARSIRNITNIMTAKEDILFKALQVAPERANRWCKKVDDRFVEILNKRKPSSKDAIEKIWYNGRCERSQNHYDESRYHALNLHAIWQKGTIEFRCFNSTTHAGKVKTYIQLALAISAQALTQKHSSAKKTASTNEKYTFRTWLLHLGMIGDEFDTARKFLLENLDGCIAWRQGRPETVAIATA